MRPELFASLGQPARANSGSLFRQGLIRVIAGAVLLGAARVVWLFGSAQEFESGARFVATVFALPGLSLFLHFGIFDLLAGLWRLAGVDCRPLFRAPLHSKSLTEFWGRRWNLAFSEMTAIGIYRPLSVVIGRRGATAAAFLASGLLHELAISVPVRASYGGPLLYFLIHGGLILIEGRLERAGKSVHRVAWAGRLWTAFWLIAPLPILFHYPFLNGVIWPLLGMENTD
jgi:alginate O-acetyltransferase complex protein AlgI